MSNKKIICVLASAFLLTTIFLCYSLSAVRSMPLLSEFPVPSMNPTISIQEADNWCGPAALQSAIDYVTNRIPQATLWAYMRDNTCKDVDVYGRDAALPGTVGNGHEHVRKMNIAYDFGADPHAMAWTMWMKTPGGHYYHYRIYNNTVGDATRKLLYAVERYDEPQVAAVWHGSHWVLVVGYDSVYPAYPSGNPGTIYRIRIANPWDGTIRWYPYTSNNPNDYPWITYWFTRYTNSDDDPDPSTGWYIPSPAHWYNHWVTIQRDEYNTPNPDWAMDGNGVPMAHQPLTFLPDIHNGSGWSSQIIIGNNGGSPANVTITYYDVNGDAVGTETSISINTNGSLSVLPPSSFIGSAVIAASQDIRAIVKNYNGYDSAAYEGIPSTPSNSGIGIGNAVYIPVNFYDYYDWYTSIYVTNAGTSATTVFAFLYDDDGNNITNSFVFLNPNARTTIEFSDIDHGSVLLITGQPLAVVISHDYSGSQTGKTLEYPGAVRDDGTTSYIPSLFKDYSGWTSSYQSLEVYGYSAHIYVTYSSGQTKQFDLYPYGHREVYLGSESSIPSHWHGSAKVAVISGLGRIITSVHHQNGNLGTLGYLGVLGGARTLFMPYLEKSGPWTASLTLKNIGTISTDVSLYLYNSAGNLVTTLGPYSLSAGASRELYNELPAGFTGSVRISSNNTDVSAVIHESNTDGQNYGYIAVP